MASNSLPDAQSKLWSLAADMSDGLKDHDPGLAQNTKAKLDPELKAAKDTQQAYTDAGNAESDATGARNIANSNAKAAIALTKRMLGDVPDALPAIWPPGTTQIPDTIPERLSLLEKAADYLKTHHDQEVPAKNFTEPKLRATQAALQTAKSDLNTKVAARVDTKAARDIADTALRARLSALIQELSGPGLLAADDDRWYLYGLVPPAGIDRPGIAPDNVHLQKLAPGTVLAGWSSTPRAQKYRPFLQVLGRDANFIAQDTTAETDLTLTNLPTTGTLKFYVQATNPAGDSPKSVVVELSLS